jgi:ArsR family transcriptional regulator
VATPTSLPVLADDRIRGCCVPLAPPLPAAQVDDLARVCKALADPTRVQMVHMLKHAEGPVCVCDFTAAFDLGQATVSHHVAKLRAAGLVVSSKHGVWSFHALRADLSPAVRAIVDAVP